MSFVPTKLYHDARNPFTLYGFQYQTIAHFLIIQTHARRGVPFKHFFDLPVEELPPIHWVNRDVLEEGLNAMLPQMQPRKLKYPISHEILGIGTTRFRLTYGDKESGKNVYGKSITRVLLKRRRAPKWTTQIRHWKNP